MEDMPGTLCVATYHMAATQRMPAARASSVLAVPFCRMAEAMTSRSCVSRATASMQKPNPAKQMNGSSGIRSTSVTEEVFMP